VSVPDSGELRVRWISAGGVYYYSRSAIVTVT
jgi:hypothetical protein